MRCVATLCHAGSCQPTLCSAVPCCAVPAEFPRSLTSSSNVTRWHHVVSLQPVQGCFPQRHTTSSTVGLKHHYHAPSAQVLQHETSYKNKVFLAVRPVRLSFPVHCSNGWNLVPNTNTEPLDDCWFTDRFEFCTESQIMTESGQLEVFTSQCRYSLRPPRPASPPVRR